MSRTVDAIHSLRVTSTCSLRFLLNWSSCGALSRCKLLPDLPASTGIVCWKATCRTGETVKACPSSCENSRNTGTCAHWQSCKQQYRQIQQYRQRQCVPRIYVASSARPDRSTASTWVWSLHVRCGSMYEYRQPQSVCKLYVCTGADVSRKQYNSKI